MKCFLKAKTASHGVAILTSRAFEYYSLANNTWDCWRSRHELTGSHLLHVYTRSRIMTSSAWLLAWEARQEMLAFSPFLYCKWIAQSGLCHPIQAGLVWADEADWPSLSASKLSFTFSFSSIIHHGFLINLFSKSYSWLEYCFSQAMPRLLT